MIEDLSREVVDVRLAGTRGNGSHDVLLQAGNEVLVTLVGHHGEHVELMHDGWIIDALTGLIARKTHAATDLIGIGASAISRVGRAFWQHARELSDGLRVV